MLILSFKYNQSLEVQGGVQAPSAASIFHRKSTSDDKWFLLKVHYIQQHHSGHSPPCPTSVNVITPSVQQRETDVFGTLAETELRH